MGHRPSSVYRGHKADIFEGGHRVPFIVRWPGRVAAGSVSDQTVCQTDLLRTFAAITDHELADNEGEDSYNLLPLLTGERQSGPLREATVHHSANGSFAIRRGEWKLIMCPGSGGWSYPRPRLAATMDSLPPVQLYRLSTDPGETENQALAEPARVEAMKELLTRYIHEGRSTPGTVQANDAADAEWEQIAFTRDR
jgi:arylsulfatase A-like enzyme